MAARSGKPRPESARARTYAPGAWPVRSCCCGPHARAPPCVRCWPPESRRVRRQQSPPRPAAHPGQQRGTAAAVDEMHALARRAPACLLCRRYRRRHRRVPTVGSQPHSVQPGGETRKRCRRTGRGGLPTMAVRALPTSCGLRAGADGADLPRQSFGFVAPAPAAVQRRVVMAWGSGDELFDLQRGQLQRWNVFAGELSAVCSAARRCDRRRAAYQTAATAAVAAEQVAQHLPHRAAEGGAFVVLRRRARV